MNPDPRTWMRWTTATATLALLMLLSVPSGAVSERGFEMEILVDGVPLHEYLARSTTYVEAIEGREYAIRFRNSTDHRVAVALAVDGLNSIDAKTTTARTASKWVVEPWQTITVSGWQTGPDTSRRFFFTTEDSSYGAWLGKTSNLGVVEAIVFREKQPHPIACFLGLEKDEAARSRREAGAADAPAAESQARPSTPAPGAKSQPSLSDEMAATGIGREVDNPVQRVHLDLESSPAAQLRVRYEYRPQLIALGVLPPPPDYRALDRREHAQGFADFAFAPDPYRR